MFGHVNVEIYEILVYIHLKFCSTGLSAVLCV